MSATAIAQHSPRQAELAFQDDFFIDPRDWQVVRMLQEELEDELRARKGKILRTLGAWCLLYNIFKKAERKALLEGSQEPSARDLQYHRVISNSLQCQGEGLIMSLKSHTELSLDEMGITFDGLCSAVSGLRADYIMWHSDQSQEKNQNVLRDVFGV